MDKTANDEIVFGREFDAFLGIGPRARRGWLARGRLPPPDGDVQGRPFWRVETFRRFKSEVIAGKFSHKKRLPRMPHTTPA